VNMLSFAFRNLYRRPARTILTISAISLGIAAVVALTSIAWGFEASWQKANDARGTDLIVTKIASENAMPSAFKSDLYAKELKTYPQVKEVAGLLSEMLSVNDTAPPLFVFGWEYGCYLWNHLSLKDGRWPANDSEPVIMIGSLAAELLHKKIGDVLEIEGHSFQIAGIFESSAMVENSALLMTLTNAQLITDKHGKVNVLNIKLKDGFVDKDIEQFKQQVHAKMPGFSAITSGELVHSNTIVRISKAMSNATILISSLVGALVVFNTMLMSINERKKDIGVLIALGWEKSSIMRLICYESIVLTLFGGLIGIALGVGLTIGLENMELMRGKIEAIFPASFVIEVVFLSVFIGLLGGIYPAFSAARLRPSDAMRHE